MILNNLQYDIFLIFIKSLNFMQRQYFQYKILLMSSDESKRHPVNQIQDNFFYLQLDQANLIFYKVSWLLHQNHEWEQYFFY